MGKITVSVQETDASAVEADAVAAFTFQDGEPDAASEGLAGSEDVSRFLETGDFKGKARETAVVYPRGLKTPRVLLGGLGERAKADATVLRDVSARLARRARDLGASHLAIVVPAIEGVEAKRAAEAIAEGALLGLYRFERYKTQDEEEDRKELRELSLVASGGNRESVEAGARWGERLAECVNLARDYATLSGDDAWPERYGERAEEIARETGLNVQVLDKRAIRELGMGGLLAVNRGSEHEPRFVVLEHKPANARGGPFVVVGKGVTFDSGGISIKPSKDMDQMRFDKSGACAVLGLLRACALLELPVHVVGLTAWTDNLPGGTAYKPGDVITMMNGKRVEVTNTDAEGRMILADCLTYASRYDPAAVVEMSTLTGGVIVALGNQAIGMMGNHDGLMRLLKESGDRTSERVWQLPMFEEYGKYLESRVADVVNSGGRNASPIQGAKFLENFIGDYPWVHLDIAGTAWKNGKPGFVEDINPGWATGVGVRLLADVLRRFERLPES